MNISLRACGVLFALATIGAIGSTGARALQGRQVAATHARLLDAQPAAASPEAAAPIVLAPPKAHARYDSVAYIPASLAAAPSPYEPGVSLPLVGEGRTELGDGLFAVREGKSVTVHFDVPQARTRRRDKFDRIVRATLPRIYGPVAQATLDRIPEGEIVTAGTLPSELQESGLRIRLTDGPTLELWPEIRDARGGALVVGYRTEVAR
jgi:hypothetical protein